MTINDLTREELLQVIIEQGLNRLITPYAIKTVRWETMTHKAKTMMDEACAEMDANKGKRAYSARTNFMLAGKKFDRAMKLYAEADKLIASR